MICWRNIKNPEILPLSHTQLLGYKHLMFGMSASEIFQNQIRNVDDADKSNDITQTLFQNESKLFQMFREMSVT